MKLPRFHFSTGQLLLLTALVALGIALGTAMYQRVRRSARPVATAFSADGKLAAVRFSDGRIRVWNDAGQHVGAVNTGQSWAIWTPTPTLAVIDEQHLATTNSTGKIEVWDIARGQRLGTFGSGFTSPDWETSSISGDGRRVATIRIGAVGGVDIWDVEQGVRVHKLKLRGLPRRLVLSHDGTRLALSDQNATLSIVDVASGNHTAGPFTLLTQSADRDTVALSGDLSTVAVVAREGADNGTTPVVIYDIAKGPPTAIAHVPGECETLTLSRAGKTLATASSTGDIYLWNTADGKQLGRTSLAVDDDVWAQFDLANSPAVAMDFSPDGKSLLAATNTSIGIYDVPRLARRANLGMIPSRLGRWFFIPAFIVWAMLWGRAARRRVSVPLARPDHSAAVTAAAGEQLEDGQARRLPYEGRPPRAMIAVWVMLLVGGVWAIVWSMLVLFSDLTCLALTPFPYFGLYVGIRAVAAGFRLARSEFNLPGIAVLQMLSILAGDLLNPLLGLANFVLLQRDSAKNYRARVTDS